MAEKVVNSRQALALAIDLSFAACIISLSAAEERSVLGGMRTSSHSRAERPLPDQSTDPPGDAR
jgi:hypothetical protein